MGNNNFNQKPWPDKKHGQNDRYHGPGKPTEPDKFTLLTPADTATAVKDPREVEHFGLRISKYLLRNDSKKNEKLAKINLNKNLESGFHGIDELLQDLLADQFQAARYVSELEQIYINKLSTTWRLAIGLGNESVLETSMTLHHTYGVPYIPGQALKGAVRSYVVNMCFGTEAAALMDKDFCRVFGGGNGAAEEKAGNIIFFDVYPTKPPKVVTDVMNPHFGPYYSDSGNKPPGDYYDPVPVNFLTVINSEFRFMAGLKRGREWKLENNRIGTGDMKTVVGEWITKSLSIFGIGAKTSVGYGRFE